jgi:hypothetical protein
MVKTAGLYLVLFESYSKNTVVSYILKRILVRLHGRYSILAESRDKFFTDVICGHGNCAAGMTYVITSNGLICHFDEH